MSWILGLLGAVLGFGLSSDHDFASALFGFGVCWTATSLGTLRSRLERTEEKLAQTQERLARLSAATRQAAAAAQALPAALRGAAAPAPRARAARCRADAGGAPRSDGRACGPAAAACAPRRLPQPRPCPRSLREPGWEQRALGAVQAWFTEGNVPVKVGVLVLFAGVAAALRYAAVEGYFTFPLELRLALIAACAVGALGFGWRERERRPAFGLSVQGGALGVLLLTVFAAFRLYRLLPPVAAFVLVLVLVAGAAALAVLQRAQPLAALGFLGGYLAPVLISTGQREPRGAVHVLRADERGGVRARVAAELADAQPHRLRRSPSGWARRGAGASTGPSCSGAWSPSCSSSSPSTWPSACCTCCARRRTRGPGWTARWCSARPCSPSRCRRRCCATSGSRSPSARSRWRCSTRAWWCCCTGARASGCSRRPTARSRWASPPSRCRWPSRRAPPRACGPWRARAQRGWASARSARCPGSPGSRCSCSRARAFAFSAVDLEGTAGPRSRCCATATSWAR